MLHTSAGLIPRRVRLDSPLPPVVVCNVAATEPPSSLSGGDDEASIVLDQRFADRMSFRAAVIAFVAAQGYMPPPSFQKRASAPDKTTLRARCMLHVDRDGQPVCSWTVSGRRVKAGSEWCALRPRSV